MAKTDAEFESPGALLRLDGRWQFPEFGALTSRYTDIYAFFYALRIDVDADQDLRLDELFVAYPWHVGYSSLNFFRDLYAAVPTQDRLRVREIRYASPGFIALLQDPSVVGSIAMSVIACAAGLERIAKFYDNIQSTLSKRKLTNIDVRRAEMNLAKEDIEFVKYAREQLGLELRLSKPVQQLLNRRTKGNRLLQLKMLLALYRRIVPIAEMFREGKLTEIAAVSAADGTVAQAEPGKPRAT